MTGTPFDEPISSVNDDQIVVVADTISAVRSLIIIITTTTTGVVAEEVCSPAASVALRVMLNDGLSMFTAWNGSSHASADFDAIGRCWASAASETSRRRAASQHSGEW